MKTKDKPKKEKQKDKKIILWEVNSFPVKDKPMVMAERIRPTTEMPDYQEKSLEC